MRADSLDPLIAATYDAVLDSSVWPRVMTMVTDALEGSCSSLLVSEAPTHRWVFIATDPRLPAEAAAEYATNWTERDAIRQRGIATLVGEVQTEEDFLDRSTEEAYNDFYLRWDWGHILGMPLLREGPFAGTFTVYKSGRRSAFSEADKSFALQIATHFKRAVQIHTRLAAARSENEMVNGGLDMLAIGVIFVDANGRVVSMNRSAREMTAARDGLMTDRAELAGPTPSCTRCIRELVYGVLHERAGAAARSELRVARPSGKRPYVLIASAISPGAAPHSAARAVVLVTDTDREIPNAPQLLRAVYSLSPAEASLAIALCDGQTMKEIALQRDVSLNTIHTQLSSLQRKIDVKRQVEVVSVLLRGPLGFLRGAPREA